MWGKKKEANTVTGPLFRAGTQACERDFHRHGRKFVLTFREILIAEDPSDWYTLGYLARSHEGD